MSNSEHFANIMVECFIRAVHQGIDLIPVVADSTSTSKIKPFMEAFPDRLVNVGIAEQAMVGTAAGLAMGGKVAVTCNAAPFLISRANEQVKVDVCYNNSNVKMFGLNAGTSYGPLASTHHAIDDISIMRGFGNVEIYAPATPMEARQIIDYAIREKGPIYIRLDGEKLPEFHKDDYCFKPGQVDILRKGGKLAIVGLGSCLHEVMKAAEKLAKEDIETTVINLSSIRPLDKDALAKALSQSISVLTVEEHNINGGIASIVAEVIAENGINAKLYSYGIRNGEYAPVGNRAYIRDKLGISATQIYNHIKKLSK